jgi:hypothetical protein
MHTSGTSFATILLASPSKIAVLPTPGGPISCSTLSTYERQKKTITGTHHGVRLCPPGQDWRKTGSGDVQEHTGTGQETHTLDGTPDLCRRQLAWGITGPKGTNFPSSLPITGSSFPVFANSVKSMLYKYEQSKTAA